MTAPGDQAVVSVFVRVSPADAFEVFTSEIELWWRTGPAYRIAGKRRGRLSLEAGVGGRLFETFEGAHGERTFVFGTITVWEPGAGPAAQLRMAGCQLRRGRVDDGRGHLHRAK